MLSNRYKYDGIPELRLNNVQLQAKSDVEEKVNSGIYLFEEIKCAICGSGSSEILAEKDRYGLKCTTKICCDCGFVYTSPRMTQDSYNNFYDSEYRRLYVGTEKPGSVFFNDQKYRGERILKYITSNINDANKSLDVLEVGCGAGGILQSFRSAGHIVLGLDLGEEYLNFGKENFGLNLKKGGLSDLDKGYKADLIMRIKG